MKSAQRYNRNSNLMKPIKKSQQQHNNQSNFQQQQVTNEWDIHTNRLNYVEEMITKLQKKINKLQKTISAVQEKQCQFNDQIGEKIAQMIEVISKQQQSKDHKQINYKRIFSEQIELLKQEVKMVAETNNTFVDNLNNLDQRILKIQSSENLIKSEVKTLIEQKITQIETKISQQIDSSIIQIYQRMESFQAKMKEFNKKIQKNQQLDLKMIKSTNRQFKEKINQDRLLTSPDFQKANYKTSLSKDKYVNSFRNHQQDNKNDQNHIITKRQDEKQNTSNIFQRKSQAVNFINTLNTHKAKSTEPVLMNENNSRVVYLRQKLKEFQNINKKYEIKDKQTDANNKRNLGVANQFSASKLKYATKQHSQVSKEFISASNSKHEPDSKKQSYLSTQKKSYTQFQSAQRLKFQRQQSGKKHFTFQQNNPSSLSENISSFLWSSKKSISNQAATLTREQSSKKIEKLKSIRDYLQQTQSQIEDSFLQPNYN